MKLRSLLFSLPVLIATCCCFADNFDNIPKLVLNGEATVQKDPDQMEVNLGVIVRGKTSAEALSQNNQVMNKVIMNLTGVGLDDTELQTCQFHIQPLYKKSKEGNFDTNVIIGYEAYNSVHVKTLKLELADKILSAAVEGGANQINQINFSLHDPKMYRAEVIHAATQSAIADATAIAEAAGVKIKRILNLNLNHWQTHPTPYMVSKNAYGGALELGHDAIEPGKTEIHATVSIVFEIGA